MIECDYPANDIKKALVGADREHFQLRFFDALYYCSDNGSVQVDLIPHRLALPYKCGMSDDDDLPAEAARIGNIQASDPPFLRVEDLIVMKLYSCGKRSSEFKNCTDARDAWSLARTLPEVVTWKPWQRCAIHTGLRDTVYFSHNKTRIDWEKALML